MGNKNDKSGVISITLNPETLRPWALNLCLRAFNGGFIQLRESGKLSFTETTHKEETKAHICADMCD